MTTQIDPERYAGFWIRSIASSIDSLILVGGSWIVSILVMGGIFWFRRMTGAFEGDPEADLLQAVDPMMMQIVLVSVYTLLSAIYFIYAHYRYGTTIGKKILGIYVIQYPSFDRMTLSQSVIRFFSQMLSGLPLCAGYLMAAFHPKKRALHDLIAATISVRQGK